MWLVLLIQWWTRKHNGSTQGPKMHYIDLEAQSITKEAQEVLDKEVNYFLSLKSIQEETWPKIVQFIQVGWPCFTILL